RHEVQHGAAGVPDGHLCRDVRLQARGALRDYRCRRSRGADGRSFAAVNLLEQQAMNRRRTWIIMIAFVAFLLFLGIGFDTFYLGEAGGVVPIGSLAALGVGLVSALVSYYSGDRAVLMSAHATPIADVAAS